MPIYRINKKLKYTAIDNNIFLNKELSFKATGLLTTMLSLPDNWDFSELGLATLKKDNLKSIKTALKELEEAGYLVRSRRRDEHGRLREIVYDVYEEPTCHFQTLENQTLEKPMLEKGIQLNTNIINNLNNKELNNNKEIYKESYDCDLYVNHLTEAVIEYLNDKTERSFKPNNSKTRSLIKARLRDGYKEHHFIEVIDTKCNEWLNTDMEMYLRPETLFGTKFENYVNQRRK